MYSLMILMLGVFHMLNKDTVFKVEVRDTSLNSIHALSFVYAI